MNDLNRTFLSAIKAVLWGDSFKYEDNVSVNDLFNEALRYEVVGLLSLRLDSICKDEEVRKKWSKKALLDYKKSLFILSAQDSLTKLLAKENIKPIFLKGMASAYYYNEPLLRQTGDIDFIILRDNYKKACELLENNGYKKVDDKVRIIEYTKQGIEYECHRYFSRNSSVNDKRIDSIIFEGCENPLMRLIEGKEFYVLPDTKYGILLLEHLKRHLVDGIGFRQLIDWTVYVDKVLDDNVWENEFMVKAKECNLEVLAKTLTKTSQLYLGLRKENISWCNDIDDEVCEDLIEMFFSCNNFGFAQEDRDSHIVGNVMRIGFFKRLNINALDHFPIAKRIIILRPIAWLYQLLRWAIKTVIYLFKKRPDYSLEKWKNQKKLLKELGVRE